MRGIRGSRSSRYSWTDAALAAENAAARRSISPSSVRSRRWMRSTSAPSTTEPTCGRTLSAPSAPEAKSRQYTCTRPRSGRMPAAVAIVLSTVDLPDPEVP